MTEADRERRIVKLLGQALELKGAARKKYLDGACAGDPELRQELEAMLGSQEELDDEGFLEVPAGAHLARTTTLGAPEVASGKWALEYLGPFRIVRPLGRGGMGTVFLGEQEKPVRRQVALKIIDAVGDRRLLKRFAAECQALARLSHPNVASLYEVGATEDGHPFVAMELVEGTAITTYCDEKQLGLRDRIQLFFGVCAGIRHAHEKGILHRDLKPSNVLVTEVDGRPTAKVIDFGIARALDKPLLTDTESMTLEHQIVGSPAYMSPEVASGNRDVDTRSDVYSLGLLLYQLLVGVLPFETQGQSMVSVLRRLAKGDLPAPGSRFAELDIEQQNRIAADRCLRGKNLLKQVRGDLDAIIGKAIARFRENRYSSPADLAADLDRHLKKRPVEVRATSYPYRLSRFMHRHLPFGLLISALILALIVGIIARTGEARRANTEAERAILEAQRFGEEARQIRQALAGSREVSSFLINLIRERRLGADHPGTAESLNSLGMLLKDQGRNDEAVVLLERAAEIFAEKLGPDHPRLGAAEFDLAEIAENQGRLEDAERHIRRAVEIWRAAYGEEHERTRMALETQRRIDAAPARTGGTGSREPTDS